MTQPPDGPGAPRAPHVVEALVDRGLSLAVAESLTGGLLLAALTDVPGVSRSVLGGVVAYDVAIKVHVLGVDPVLLAREGPVDPDVAEQMARGVRALMGADVAVATTGEAGPESATGKPVGLFYVAVDSREGTRSDRRQASGGRDDIRREAVQAALELVWTEAVGQDSASG